MIIDQYWKKKNIVSSKWNPSLSVIIVNNINMMNITIAKTEKFIITENILKSPQQFSSV